MPGHARAWNLARRLLAAMLGLGAVVASLPAHAETAPEGEITFFDALVTLGPGISREVDVTVDHIRGSMMQPWRMQRQ